MSRSFFFLLLLIFALPCRLPAQTPPLNAPGRLGSPPQSLKPLLSATASGKKLISIDGRPTPLFWADGITQAAQLDTYARCGLNTVVVRLTWRPLNGGSLAVEDLQPQRNFAIAAAQKGLHIIYSLPPAPFGSEYSFRVAADSNAYILMWAAWVQSAVSELKDTPGLIGWMLPDDPRALPFLGDAGLARWLEANFADVQTLNRQWQSRFASLRDVPLEEVRQLIAAQRLATPIPAGLGVDATRRLQEQNRLRAATPAELAPFHPAALALAHYGWDAYRALLSAWARIVDEADPAHIIFAGRLPDYAQLLALPAGIDVSVPDVRPDVAEADFATHNPHAVDIARRGGRFAAIPMLSTAASPGVPETALPLLLPAWADAALAHGASGLAFSSWPALLRGEAVRRALTSTLARLKADPFAALWEQAPVATTAVLLTPLADGFTRLTPGPEGAPAEARGLYGFGEALVRDEPSDLVYALRWGTPFGGVDYLAPDDLDAVQSPDDMADDDNLGRYSLLLMPQALSLSPAQVRRLARYVGSGGVLVADLGAGAAQVEGNPNALPPELATLLGIAPALRSDVSSFNLRSIETHPLLPAWGRVAGDKEGTLLTAGDGPGGAAFAGPMAFDAPLPGTITLASGLERSVVKEEFGIDAPQTSALLTLRPLGNGFAIFAPFRLWNFWRPGHFGFDSFHGDLWSRGAAVALIGAPSIVPAPRPGLGGTTTYPEIVNFAGAIALLNHNVARPVDKDENSANAAPGNAAPPKTAPPKTAPRNAAPAKASGVAAASISGDNSFSDGSIEHMNGVTQPALVQTSGVGEFLWSSVLCAFPTSSDSSLSGGRSAPIADPDDAQQKPHTVMLHALVRAQEMKVSRLLPIRAQNLAGGALMAQVTQWKSGSVKLVLWPNATQLRPNQNDFEVQIAERGPIRLTLHQSADAADYLVLPNSRHRVVMTDLLAPFDKKGRRPAPLQRILTADAQGRLTIEVTGAALQIEIGRAL